MRPPNPLQITHICSSYIVRSPWIWGVTHILDDLNIFKHLETPKTFIPQVIQNHFSCFAPSGGAVFPLNSSTCSTANSPFVSVPVLSKPAQLIKGLSRSLQRCTCDSYNDQITDSSFIFHALFFMFICLKQLKSLTYCISNFTILPNRGFH